MGALYPPACPIVFGATHVFNVQRVRPRSRDGDPGVEQDGENGEGDDNACDGRVDRSYVS